MAVQKKIAKKRHTPITSANYYQWAIDEFKEMKAKYGVRKATKMFNAKYE